MEVIEGKGRGTQYKMPDGLLCHCDSRDKLKYPKRFWCIHRRECANCRANWVAHGPAPDQLVRKVVHVAGCQRSLPPAENSVMKEELEAAVLANPNMKLPEIYKEVTKRYMKKVRRLTSIYTVLNIENQYNVILSFGFDS